MATELILRRDQDKAVYETGMALKDHQAVLLQAATGFGKTIVAARMGLGAQKKGRRVIIGVHRRELARQTALTLDRFGVSYGFIASGMTSDPFATVQIASADTVANKPQLLKCDLFIPDEAHLWAAKTRAGILERVKEHGGQTVGLSATPERLDGLPLGDLFDFMVAGPSPKWLIEQGYLSQYRAFAPSAPDLKGLRKNVEGEYSKTQLGELLDKPSIIGNAIEAHRKYAAGLRTIVFAFSRAHGRHLCETYNASGISAVYVDGDTPDGERRGNILKFARGQAEVLINIDLCIEGFDLSAQVGFDVPVEAVSLQRPTESLPRALQMIGRALRKKDRPAVLMDHVNLLATHGLPDDDRVWTLDGVDRKARADDGTGVRICPKCFGAVPSGANRCPYCRTGVDITAGRKVEEVAGELHEIDLEAVRRSRKIEVARAETLPQLAAVAVSQGHKSGWIRHLLKARGKPQPSWDDCERALNKARLDAHERNKRTHGGNPPSGVS